VVSEADFRIGLSTGIYASVAARKRPSYEKTPWTSQLLLQKSITKRFGEELENYNAKKCSKILEKQKLCMP
jgi:hypothetical protein